MFFERIAEYKANRFKNVFKKRNLENFRLKNKHTGTTENQLDLQNFKGFHGKTTAAWHVSWTTSGSLSDSIPGPLGPERGVLGTLQSRL